MQAQGKKGPTHKSGSNDHESGARRRSREMALQLLFQSEFSGQAPLSADEATASAERFCRDFSVDRQVADYARQLFCGIQERRAAIDQLIQGQSIHWKTSRMGLIDLSVMRIAVFEMQFLQPMLPAAVAIDEAVELAKLYGSAESGSFVNGILDQIGSGAQPK